MHRNRSIGYLSLLLFLVGCSGCDKIQPEETPKLYPPIAEDHPGRARPAPTANNETRDVDGNATISLYPPVESVVCWIRLFPFQAAEGNLVQLFNYGDPGMIEDENEAFFFIQGVTTAATFFELDGTTVPCQLFVKTGPNGPIWSNPDESPIPVEFKLEAGQLKASFRSQTVKNASNRTTLQVDGDFECAAR